MLAQKERSINVALKMYMIYYSDMKCHFYWKGKHNLYLLYKQKQTMLNIQK